MKIKILEVNRIEQNSINMDSINVKYEIDGKEKGMFFVNKNSALLNDSFLEKIKEYELNEIEDKNVKTDVSSNKSRVVTPLEIYKNKEVEI